MKGNGLIGEGGKNLPAVSIFRRKREEAGKGEGDKRKIKKKGEKENVW